MVALVRLLLAALVILAAPSGSHAVGVGETESPEIVTIRADAMPPSLDTSPGSIAQRRVLQTFLKGRPYLRIERFSMPQIAGAAMDMGPLMAIAAGSPPHAIYVNFRQSSTYIDQGFLEPMEILLARLHSADSRTREVDAGGKWLADPTEQEIARALEEIKARVNPIAWPVVYRDDERAGRNDGPHVWAIPTSTLVSALWYRKDLFIDAGLDPNKPPANWDELLDYARKLTIPERGQYGLGLHDGQEMGWSVYSFMVANGARAVGRNEGGQWVASYDSPAATEAVSFFLDLAQGVYDRNGRQQQGAVRFGGADLNLAWERGQLGMQIGHLKDELLAGVNPQLVGIAPIPLSRTGMRSSELNCAMLGVFSGASPKQKLAVIDLIWYFTSEESEAIRTQSYVESGYGRFVNPVLLKKYGYDRILRMVPGKWINVFESTLSNGVPEPYGRNTQNIYRYMSEPIQSALEQGLVDLPPEQRLARIQALLHESVEEVNTEVMGNLPESTLRFRRIVGSIAMAGIALIFALGFRHIWKYFTSIAVRSEKRPLKRYAMGYVLLLPALTLMVLWLYLPLVGGLGISVLDYRLELPSTLVYVDNFATVLFDERFWAGFARTLYFVVLTIALGFWPPILLAILLDEVPTATFKYIFRTLFYLPAIISGVVIMFLWKELYTPTEFGMLNQVILSVNALSPTMATIIKLLLLFMWITLIVMLFILPKKVEEMARPMKLFMWIVGTVFIIATALPLIHDPSSAGSIVGAFHMTPLRWIQSPELVMLCVVIPSIWAGTGPGCLLYLAALKTIPSDLYEAADIDGATLWHKVFYITLPRLKFLIGIQFIAAVVAAFKGGTDFILALTGGGPNNASMILALEIFIRTFGNLSFGLGAAMAWILGAALIGLTAYQLKMLARAEFGSGESR